MKLVKPKLSFVADDDEQLELPQVWECSRCERRRQWGYGPSVDPNRRPYLYCSCRKKHLPHTFAGLKAS